MKSGLFTALPYFIATALAWVLAHLSDRWLEANGGGTTGRRRLVVVLAMLSAAVVLLAPLADNVGLILALITVSLTGLATGISLNIALASDLLQSPRDSAKAMAIQVSGGNIFGIIAPIATGYTFSWTGGYNLAFMDWRSGTRRGRVADRHLDPLTYWSREEGSPLFATIAE